MDKVYPVIDKDKLSMKDIQLKKVRNCNHYTGRSSCCNSLKKLQFLPKKLVNSHYRFGRVKLENSGRQQCRP